MGPMRVRTLFLSDIHLGSKGCQADKLLDFLRHYEADTVYLVGDIVDGWQLKSNWYWPQSHNDVVQKLLRQARKGARLLYIPGNHDEFLRDYYGTHFGGIDVLEDAIHVGIDGKRYLVIHGDLFDVVIRHARWLALLGNNAYDLAIWLNTHFNAIRRALGLTYWSLSQWAKLKVKNAVNFIGEYETTLAAEARRRGVDGVICGHIHHAVIRNEFRLVLHQLRRLGRKLHGCRGTLRRPIRDRQMDRAWTAPRRVGPRGRPGPGAITIGIGRRRVSSPRQPSWRLHARCQRSCGHHGGSGQSSFVFCVIALACLSGPLFPFEPLPSGVAEGVAKAPDLDAYLRRREAQNSGVRPELAKTILWNDPAARNKTRWRWSTCTDSRRAEEISLRWSKHWRQGSGPTPS